MGYMRVKHKDETSLVLVREPTLLSIATYFAFVIVAGAIIVFGHDSIFYKFFLSVGACFLSYALLHKYEICEFDKANSEVRTTSLIWSRYWIGKILGTTPQPNMLVRLADIEDVQVKESEDSPSKAFQVILVLRDGQMMGITETATNDHAWHHEEIKDEIKNFMGDFELAGRDADDEAEDGSNDDDEEEEDDEDSTDDFEQISPAELESLKESGDMVGEVGAKAVGTEGAGEAGDAISAPTKEEEMCPDQEQASS